MVVLIFLMVLATVGIGLSGGVPLPQTDRRKKVQQFNNEWVEQKKDNEKKLGVFEKM